MRVMVIDDETLVRNIIVRFLELNRVDSHGVGSGIEAEAALRLDSSYDAVFLDLMMPDISGLDVLKWIRKNPETAELPVILMSGAKLSPDEEASIEGLEVTVFPKSKLTIERFSALLGEMGLADPVKHESVRH